MRTELAQLVAAGRAHLEGEIGLGRGGLGIPEGRESVAAGGAAAPGSDARAPQTPPTQIPATPTAAQASRPVSSHGQPGDKQLRLTQLASEAAVCTACALHEKRKQSVFARGSADAELVFVGEGPG